MVQLRDVLPREALTRHVAHRTRLAIWERDTVGAKVLSMRQHRVRTGSSFLHRIVLGFLNGSGPEASQRQIGNG